MADRAPDFDDHVFRSIVESWVSPFVIVDSAGTVRWVGPRIEQLLGSPPETWVGDVFLDRVAPASREAALAAFEDFVAIPGSNDTWIGPPMVLELLHADGSLVPCDISASLGTHYGIDGVVLQIRRSRGTPLLYDAVDALAVGAPLDDILARLAALCEHDTPGSSVAFGWDWDGEHFRSSATSSASPDQPDIRLRSGPSPWSEAMATGDTQGGGYLRTDHPELADEAEAAGYSTCWAIPISVRSEDTPSAAMVLWRATPGGARPHRTTTAQRVARLAAFALESAGNLSRLQREANTDALTGLDNRAAQRRTLVDQLRGDTRTVVLFCDLDDFKPINDHHGHDVGDQLLSIVARRMREATRTGDHLARWGGDEFVVICEAIGDAEVETLADRLIETVQAPVVLRGLRLRVGMSIGIATSDMTDEPDELLTLADEALHESKIAGKNRWRIHD